MVHRDDGAHDGRVFYPRLPAQQHDLYQVQADGQHQDPAGHHDHLDHQDCRHRQRAHQQGCERRQFHSADELSSAGGRFLLRDSQPRSQVWKDTVTVKKENYSHFESVDCGPSFFHTITDVKTTHNYIDSIVINNKEVNYDASKAHFYIYFGNRH